MYLIRFLAGQIITEKFKLVSKPNQDDLGTKTIAAYLLSDGKTKKCPLKADLTGYIKRKRHFATLR